MNYRLELNAQAAVEAFKSFRTTCRFIIVVIFEKAWWFSLTDVA
jgi:hypothetical protein